MKVARNSTPEQLCLRLTVLTLRESSSDSVPRELKCLRSESFPPSCNRRTGQKEKRGGITVESEGISAAMQNINLYIPETT